MQMSSNMDQIERKRLPLSARMQAILSMLRQETLQNGTKIPCVADIGCDHAFVSMACVRDGIAEHVIAMDVRKGPLSIACDHVKEYGFGKSVETRLSDGFEALKSMEADWAILAGMGGELMKTILQKGNTHLNAGIGLILQPQSELYTVRTYLEQQGYKIEDEDFLQEDGKFYTIIKAKKKDGQTTQDRLSVAQLKYGQVLLEKENVEFWNYLSQELEKFRALQNRLHKNSTGSSMKRYQELEEECTILNQILESHNKK